MTTQGITYPRGVSYTLSHGSQRERCSPGARRDDFQVATRWPCLSPTRDQRTCALRGVRPSQLAHSLLPRTGSARLHAAVCPSAYRRCTPSTQEVRDGRLGQQADGHPRQVAHQARQSPPATCREGAHQRRGQARGGAKPEDEPSRVSRWRRRVGLGASPSNGPLGVRVLRRLAPPAT